MISQKSQGVLFDVRVFPRSGVNRISLSGDNISVKLKSAPAGGMANRELVRLLSGLLSVPQKNISILRGMSSRNKVVEAQGITREELIDLLTETGGK